MSAHSPYIKQAHPSGMGGVQKLYRFANNFGASVVQFQHSYGGAAGLWELAVIKFRGASNGAWTLRYDTGITDDVEGHLTDADVEDLLDRIAALEAEEL